MLILESTSFSDTKILPQAPSLPGKKILLYSGVVLGVGVLAVPAIFALANTTTPTGTYLDPRPQQEMAMTVTPTPITNSTQLILSAQAYLEKAIAVSAKADQTPDDKQQIITLLNQSLDYSNQAVLSAPNSPQTYLIRARVLASSSAIRPDAIQLAQKDLEFAQKLSGGQQVDLPTQVNLLNLSPTQQASLAQNLIIAAPGDAPQAATVSGQSSSNIDKKLGTIPAGQLTTTITNPLITADNYLYVVAVDSSQPIFIQAKDTGSATIATTSESTTPISFEYWIVRP